MIFVKYALFFLALLSISTAAHVVNDDGNRGLFNASPSHSVEKRVNPGDSGGPTLPDGHQSLPYEAHPGLLPGALYHREEDGIIYLNPAIDDNLQHIPGQANFAKLVPEHDITFLLQRQRLGDMTRPNRYGIDLNGYRVKISSIETITESSFHGKPFGYVKAWGMSLLRHDILTFKLHSRGPLPSFLYVLNKKGKKSVTQVLIICLGPVFDKQHRPIPGQFIALELVETEAANLKHLVQQSHIGDMQPASRYFYNPSSIRVVLGDKSHKTLDEFSIRLTAKEVNAEDVVKTPLAEVDPTKWALLRHQHAALYGYIHYVIGEMLSAKRKKDNSDVALPGTS